MELPPCIAKILENKVLLDRYAKFVIRYINQHVPEKLSVYMRMLAEEGVSVNLSVDIFQPFDCSELGELCDNSCPLRQDIFNWLRQNTKEVLKMRDVDNEGRVYLLVKTNNGGRITIDLSSDKVARQFSAQVAFMFNRYIDLDLRRKIDRQRWQDLINYWVSKAREVRVEDVDEDKALIKDIALNYLYSLPVVPLEDWKGDNAAFTEDGQFAYYPKDALRRYVSASVNRRISLKLLTALLSSEGIKSVRKRVNGMRYSLYMFRMSDEQLQNLKEFKKIEETEKEDKEEKREEEGELFDWDLSELLER